MLPDRVSNPGPLTYESGALPIALRGPAINGGNLYIFIYPLSAWPNMGIVALWRSKILADIMGSGVQSIVGPKHY